MNWTSKYRALATVATGWMILATVMSGCCNAPTAAVSLDPNTIRYPDFETFPTPREFDGPGTVFRIDAEGKQHLVEQLPVTVDGPFNEALATSVDVSSVSIHAVGQLLAGPGVFRDVSASAGTVGSALQAVDLGQGSRFRTREKELDAAVESLKIDFKPGNRYYVVREAIAISKIDYVLAEWVAANAGIRATLEKIVQGSAGIAWTDIATRRMSQSFSQKHYLFYLPDEVFPPAPGVLEGAGSRPSRAPIDLKTRRVIWSSEAERDSASASDVE